MLQPNGNTVDQWNAQGGDAKFRFNYKLNENSLIIDGGAYHGSWLKKMHDLYNCRVIAYEPTLAGFVSCSELIIKNITLKKLGLSNSNSKATISNENDGSSIFSKGGSEEIQLVDTKDELATWGDSVDVLKLNVEGAEYDILERIIELNAVTKFKNFQVQFHRYDSIPNAVERRNHIREVLSKTHHLTYDFTFIWENWEIN